jgi:hypothetical protein
MSSMLRNFDIYFTVYEDDAMTITNSNLTGLTTIVSAFMPQQAEAMIRAQYNNRAHIFSVVQK